MHTQILKTRGYSSNPADWYLSFVLAKLIGESPGYRYATWLVNSCNPGKAFYCEGHYFDTLDEAEDDFNSRK